MVAQTLTDTKRNLGKYQHSYGALYNIHFKEFLNLYLSVIKYL